MNLFKKCLPQTIVACCFCLTSFAHQNPDVIYASNIHTVRFHMYGDQETMPIYKLNSGDRLELHFDDMDTRVKNYYYTYQLCDYNWQPVNLSTFDYVKGFTQMRISTYRYSSIAYTRYVHYQATLPEQNSIPSRSGNYLLKVFLDGDTSKTVFTRGILVLDPKATISTQIVQPFVPQFYKTHQRLRFSVKVDGLNAFDANRQVKVLVLQNYRWDKAQGNIPPTFVRGSSLEFDNENNFVFAGGKEWRWLDLRSLQLLSERIDHADKRKTPTEMFVKPDYDLSSQRYVFYQDLNGQYMCTTYESINPYWQGDYANVNFTFVPPNQQEYKDKDLYMIGQLTDYQLNDQSKLNFDVSTGTYHRSQLLKQGYYNYGYLLVDRSDPSKSTELLGNYWEAENVYTILVYYKSFTDQSDQLIGVGTVDTRTDKPGFSF